MKSSESKSLQRYLEYADEPAKLDSAIETMDKKFRGFLCVMIVLLVVRIPIILKNSDAYYLSDLDGWAVTWMDISAFILLIILTTGFRLRLHMLWVLKASVNSGHKKTAAGTSPTTVED